jgi:hypothetical protein
MAADWEVPETQTYILGELKSLPKITPTGNVPANLRWLVVGDQGKTPPFEVIGQTFVLLAGESGVYRVFVWKDGNSRETQQSVVVLKGGDPRPSPVTPQPEGEGPYPQFSKEVTQAFKETPKDPTILKKDALTLFFYYGMLAERIQKDGEKEIPLTKISEIHALIKAHEIDMLSGTNLSPLSSSYPAVSAKGAEKFRELFSNQTDDILTPEIRAVYINLFKAMSLAAAGAAMSEE